MRRSFALTATCALAVSACAPRRRPVVGGNGTTSNVPSRAGGSGVTPPGAPASAPSTRVAPAPAPDPIAPIASGDYVASYATRR